jgi:hypothetical protein
MYPNPPQFKKESLRKAKCNFEDFVKCLLSYFIFLALADVGSLGTMFIRLACL